MRATKSDRPSAPGRKALLDQLGPGTGWHCCQGWTAGWPASTLGAHHLGKGNDVNSSTAPEPTDAADAPPPPSGRDQAKAHALGLTSATGLVIGSVVGTGVFTMPAVLAGAGTMSVIVLVVVAAGALVLATLFGQLTKRVPQGDGGLYAYARHEFGDFAGYLVGWCYWISAWAGNAAIVSSIGVSGSGRWE